MRDINISRAVFLVLALTSLAAAEVPQTINYQGRLTDSAGVPIDTVVSMTFTIYDSLVGGNQLWTEAHDSVNVARGLFAVVLGSITPLETSDTWRHLLGLGIRVGTDAELAPRTALTSVPYAFISLHADTAAFAHTAAVSIENPWAREGNIVKLANDADTVVIGPFPSGKGLQGRLNCETIHLEDAQDPSVQANIGNDEIDMHTAGEGMSTHLDAGSVTVEGAQDYISTMDGDGFMASDPDGNRTEQSSDRFELKQEDSLGMEFTAWKMDGSGSYLKLPGHFHGGIHIYDSEGNEIWKVDEEGSWHGIPEDNHDYYYWFNPEGDTTVTISPDGMIRCREFVMPTGAGSGLILTSDDSGNGAWQPPVGAPDSDWTISSNDMYSAVTGNVGIGTIMPSHKLDVAGSAGFDDTLYHNGDADTYMLLRNNQIDLYAGGVQLVTAKEAAQNTVVFNEGGVDVDFRVESDIDPTAIFLQGSNGYVGIGTASPLQKLHIAGIPGTDGIRFPDGTVQTTAEIGNTLDKAYDQGGAGAGRTINATDGFVDIDGPDGLRVEGHMGVGGVDPGNANGVDYSESYETTETRTAFSANITNSSTGTLYGINAFVSHPTEGTGGFAYGGYFEVRSDGNSRKGCFGYAMAESSVSSSGYSYGVQGQARRGAVAYGVYGYAADATVNYAGYFSGNAHVSGTFTAGSKLFKIDHPLDPENKYLYHASVESPDMMNIYNGNVTTDGQGLATVILPDYFTALNRDFKYQLTVIGEFAQAIIGEEIRDNRFIIRTDKPNIRVSWQVTGIRKDAYAEANRMIVEVAKPENERGLYLHPEAFGKPARLGVDYKHQEMAERDHDGK
jgi:hypothetical protein